MEKPADSSRNSTVVTIFGLLRHGQTEWNILKKIQGSADSPLSAAGKKQTAAWAESLKKSGWDRIIASDLGRVRATVAILNEKLHLPVIFDAQLREQHWGEWEGMTLPDVQQHCREDLARRVAMGWEFAAPGGETRRAVKDRVLATLRRGAQQWPGQKILVVCHRGVIKSVLYAFDGRDFLPGEDPLLQHNRLHLISYNGEDFAPLQLNVMPTTPP